MARALAACGGDAVHVPGHDLIDRARELGRLVDAHDLVVLHIHPMEVAASIALADRDGRPPVLFVNHADHCFWLAPRVPDVVLSSRPAAARLCTARRGVHPDRSALLPVPAEPAAAPPPRDAARRALGLGDDDVALVAMASAYKLAAIDDIGFAELVEPALAAIPQAVVLVVGPDDDGPWAEARARSGGRLRALGRLDDPSGVLAAADVFLDGYPCSSLTAALEAAALGIPVVSYAPPRPQAATYDIDEPALAGVHVVARTRDAHLAALRDLAADPAARADLGARTAAAAAAMHDRGRWAADLEAAYDRARACAADGPLAGAEPVTDDATAHEDAFLLALHDASGLALTPAGALLRNGDAFPCDPRRGLSVVVHCRDDAEGLMRALGSAVETCAGLDDVEAIVIDDASGPAAAAVIDGLRGDVRVVRNPAPLGPQASFAAALEVASGQAALLMTSDVVLLPGWLDPLGRGAGPPRRERRRAHGAARHRPRGVRPDLGRVGPRRRRRGRPVRPRVGGARGARRSHGGRRMMNACTIVARNYLAQASALADSFVAANPDGVFTIFAIDLGDERDRVGRPARARRGAGGGGLRARRVQPHGRHLRRGGARDGREADPGAPPAGRGRRAGRLPRPGHPGVPAARRDRAACARARHRADARTRPCRCPTTASRPARWRSWRPGCSTSASSPSARAPCRSSTGGPTACRAAAWWPPSSTCSSTRSGSTWCPATSATSCCATRR